MSEELIDIVTPPSPEASEGEPTPTPPLRRAGGQVAGNGKLPESADEDDIRVWVKRFIERYRSALEALAKK